MDERRIGAEERGMDIEVGEEEGIVGDEVRKVGDEEGGPCGEERNPGHRIDIGQKLHSRVKSVPECQPTSGVAAMLKATKPEEIL